MFTIILIRSIAVCGESVPMEERVSHLPVENSYYRSSTFILLWISKSNHSICSRLAILNLTAEQRWRSVVVEISTEGSTEGAMRLKVVLWKMTCLGSKGLIRSEMRIYHNHHPQSAETSLSGRGWPGSDIIQLKSRCNLPSTDHWTQTGHFDHFFFNLTFLSKELFTPLCTRIDRAAQATTTFFLFLFRESKDNFLSRLSALLSLKSLSTVSLMDALSCGIWSVYCILCPLYLVSTVSLMDSLSCGIWSVSSLVIRWSAGGQVGHKNLWQVGVNFSKVFKSCKLDISDEECIFLFHFF